MDVGAVVDLVRGIAGVDLTSRVAVMAGVGDVRRVMSWCEARQVELAGALGTLSSFPEKDLAEANRTELGPALKLMRRADTTTAFSSFATALNAGEITGGHVDAIGKAFTGLEDRLRPQLLAQDDRLAYTASHSTVAEFYKVLTERVRSIEADGGMKRFERQRRNTRLRLWIDKATGMGRLTGEFDPMSTAIIDAKLRARTNALFAQTAPDTCPSDPTAKQDHLRALALVDLLDANGTTANRPEIVVVIDTTAPTTDGSPTVDWGLPVEIPMRVLAEFAHNADVHTVIVRNGVVLHAPGTLDLGRTTRIANRAQRRALRALHHQCAIPGCAVRFDYCKIHHIHWWRHGGTTDLANLVPVCDKHHHNIHDHAWTIELATNRHITITLPDGTQLAQPPPTTRAA